MTNYKELVRQKTNIPTTIEEVERFETWWNKNLATVINYNGGNYHVFLLVYDKERDAIKVFPDSFSCGLWGEHKRKTHDYFSDARDEAKWLMNRLISGEEYKKPILLIIPYSGHDWNSFREIINSKYVKAKNLPVNQWKIDNPYQNSTEAYPQNPSSYLKPLDIVKIQKSIAGNNYCHFGIYLGGDKMVHYTTLGSASDNFKDNPRTVITEWKKFLWGGTGELVGYSPIVPFRYYSDIAEHIIGDDLLKWGENRYCLANNNCEHYANSRIYGLSYSEQVANRPSKALEYSHRKGLFSREPKCDLCRAGKTNNSKDSFNLRSELGKGYQCVENWQSEEIERQYLQEVPAKEPCRIM